MLKLIFGHLDTFFAILFLFVKVQLAMQTIHSCAVIFNLQFSVNEGHLTFSCFYKCHVHSVMYVSDIKSAISCILAVLLAVVARKITEQTCQQVGEKCYLPVASKCVKWRAPLPAVH